MYVPLSLPCFYFWQLNIFLPAEVEMDCLCCMSMDKCLIFLNTGAFIFKWVNTFSPAYFRVVMKIKGIILGENAL